MWLRVYDNDNAEHAEIKGEGYCRVGVDKSVTLEDNETCLLGGRPGEGSDESGLH